MGNQFFVLLILGSLSIFNINCGSYVAIGGSGQSGQSSQGESNTNAPINPPNQPPPVAGQTFSLSGMPAASMKLAETQSFTTSIKSDTFAGTVALEVDRDQLAGMDLEGDVVVEIDPSQITLAAGQSQDFTINVTAKDMAPSLSEANIKIIAKDMSGESPSVTGVASVTVQPILEMKMYGGNVVADRWNRPAGPLNIRDHAAGLTVNFINMDTADTHIVHGSGAVPHGPRNNPMAAAPAPGQPGGIYTVNIAAGTVDDGGYYYHDIENGSLSRDISFGVANNAAIAARLQLNGASQSKVVLTAAEKSQAPGQEKCEH